MKKKPTRKGTKTHIRKPASKPIKKAKKSKLKKTAHKKKIVRKVTDNSAPQVARADSVVITMVVDESGSMAGLFEATCAGFNEYVSSVQRDLKDTTATFSAITFDTTDIRILQKGVDLKDAIKLDRNNYNPNGGTPLLDAVGQAITATDSVMVTRKANKAIVVVQTDGQENASQKYKLADIKVMIEQRQSKGWEFVFIGAGINAFDDAVKMGINTINPMSYTPDAAGTRATFSAMASNTAGYSSGHRPTMNFTLAQSVASGEDGGIIAAKMAQMSNSEKRPHAAMNKPDAEVKP